MLAFSFYSAIALSLNMELVYVDGQLNKYVREGRKCFVIGGGDIFRLKDESLKGAGTPYALELIGR